MIWLVHLLTGLVGTALCLWFLAKEEGKITVGQFTIISTLGLLFGLFTFIVGGVLAVMIWTDSKLATRTIWSRGERK
jgi:hypothetical protein